MAFCITRYLFLGIYIVFVLVLILFLENTSPIYFFLFYRKSSFSYTFLMDHKRISSDQRLPLQGWGFLDAVVTTEYLTKRTVRHQMTVVLFLSFFIPGAKLGNCSHQIRVRGLQELHTLSYHVLRRSDYNDLQSVCTGIGMYNRCAQESVCTGIGNGNAK